MASEVRCPKCDGCGKVADTDDQERRRSGRCMTFCSPSWRGEVGSVGSGVWLPEELALWLVEDVMAEHGDLWTWAVQQKEPTPSLYRHTLTALKGKQSPNPAALQAQVAALEAERDRLREGIAHICALVRSEGFFRDVEWVADELELLLGGNADA